MRTTATMDEASRQNFIGRLEQERFGATGKVKTAESNFRSFLLKNVHHVVGLVIDHRDMSAFLHQREGHRAGLNAAHSAVAEIDWVLDELKRQSAEYAEQLNQLKEAA